MLETDGLRFSLFVLEFGALTFHEHSGGLLEFHGKEFTCAVEFPADRIGTLFRKIGDFGVAEFLVSDEQQQKTVFRRQLIQRALDSLSQFLQFDDSKGGGRVNRIVLEQLGVVGRQDMTLRPFMLNITAMIDGNPIEPRPPGGTTFKLLDMSPGFQEDIMRGVLRLLGVTQETQAKIINRPAVLLVQRRKVRCRLPQGVLTRFRTRAFVDQFIGHSFHH